MACYAIFATQIKPERWTCNGKEMFILTAISEIMDVYVLSWKYEVNSEAKFQLLFWNTKSKNDIFQSQTLLYFWWKTRTEIQMGRHMLNGIWGDDEKHFWVYGFPKLSGLIKPWCMRLAEVSKVFTLSSFARPWSINPCSPLRKPVLCMRYVFFVSVMMNYFLAFPLSMVAKFYYTVFYTQNSLVRFGDCLLMQNKQILDGNAEDRQWKFLIIYCLQHFLVLVSVTRMINLFFFSQGWNQIDVIHVKTPFNSAFSKT